MERASARGAPHSIRAERGCPARLVFQGQLKRQTTMEMAIASLTGVTSGVAQIVACLLVPDEVGGTELWNLRKGAPVWQGRETVEGDSCSVVRLGDQEAIEVAVRERDFAVRRIMERHAAYDSPPESAAPFGVSADMRRVSFYVAITHDPTILTDGSPEPPDE